MKPHFDWFLIMVATVSGLLGGCGAISYRIISGKELGLIVVLSYLILGAVLGGMTFVILSLFSLNASIETILLLSGLMGAGSSATVAAMRTGMRLFLKYRGIEIKVEVHEKNNRNDDDGPARLG